MATTNHVHLEIVSEALHYILNNSANHLLPASPYYDQDLRTTYKYDYKYDSAKSFQSFTRNDVGNSSLR